jgi:hypothetical protein
METSGVFRVCRAAGSTADERPRGQPDLLCDHHPVEGQKFTDDLSMREPIMLDSRGCWTEVVRPGPVVRSASVVSFLTTTGDA